MRLKIKKVPFNSLRIIILSFLFAGTIFSQTTGNLAEEINVVSFPSDQEINVPLVPDGKFSGVGGIASVDLDERGKSTLRISVRSLPSVFDIGGLYASYVVWVVLPDGSTQRLGELIPEDPKKASDSQLKGIVNLNTFGIVVTVEPHPLVRIPSRGIVLKSGLPLNKEGKKVKTGTIKCLFDETDYSRTRKKLTSKEDKERRRKPIALIAAENAVTLARYSDAETNVSELYNEAEVSLKKVVAAWQSNLKRKDLELLANQTIQLAVSAEKKSLEVQQNGIEIVKENKISREINELKESLAAAEAQRSLFEENLTKVAEQKDSLQRNFDAKFSQSIRLEAENDSLKAEVIKLKVENEKLQMELLRIQGKINFTRELPVLENFLKIFGQTRKEENGLVLGLGNEIWLDQESTEISQEQTLRLEPLFRKIAETKYFQVMVFASTNAGEDVATAQSFIEARARSIKESLIKFGVEKERVRTQALVQNEVSKIKKAKSRNANLIKVEISLTVVD